MSGKDNDSNLEKVSREANREANRTLLIWGGIGILCAIIAWWLL